MYWIDQDKGDDLRRNTLSIRFTDKEHGAICDAAWKNRISVSTMIRDLVFSGMRDRGLMDDIVASGSPKAPKAEHE